MSTLGMMIMSAKRRRASWQANPLFEPRTAIQRLTQEINRLARSNR